MRRLAYLSLLLLSACAVPRDSQMQMCNYDSAGLVAVAPLTLPICLFMGIVAPWEMWPDTVPPPAAGGYEDGDGGGSGADFWGGIGSQHLGGGYTIDTPEGREFVNPPLIFP